MKKKINQLSFQSKLSYFKVVFNSSLKNNNNNHNNQYKMVNNLNSKNVKN